MEILFIIGIAQAVFFCYFLMIRKDNIMANRILSVWLILISFSLLLQYFYVTDIIRKIPHFVGLDSTFPFLYLPILYFYTVFLTSEKKGFKGTDVLHLIPFVGYFFYIFFEFYLKSGSYKYEFLQNLMKGEVPTYLTVINYLKFIQAGIYLYFIHKAIKRHQKKIEEVFSFTEQINLKWLMTITLSLAIIYFFKILQIVSMNLNNGNVLTHITVVADLSEIVFVYVIAFIGIKQPQIYTKAQPIETVEENVKLGQQDARKDEQKPVEKIKYKGSPITGEESEKLLKQLQEYMGGEKPYLENKLSINDVAEKLEINTKYLSQVINEQLNQNFFNFINTYRIEEVKNRLKDRKYSHLSILGIALDSGFNSKSSFNSIFKKVTGLTPSDYISGTS